MARSKSAPKVAVEPTQVVVSSSHIEDDYLEEAVADERQRINQSFSLGNGGYMTRARAMSDDL